MAGEACFSIDYKETSGSVYPSPSFTIGLNKRDGNILEEIRKEFNKVGAINEHKTTDSLHWTVNKGKELKIIADKIRKTEDHLWEKTEKETNFNKWCEAVDIYATDGHSTQKDRIRMAEIAQNINEGGRKGKDWSEVVEKMRNN